MGDWTVQRWCAAWLACVGLACSTAVPDSSRPACEVCECSAGLPRVVYCKDRGLRELPRGIPNDTRLLDLSGNFLRDISSDGQLRGLKSLVHLNVTMNSISTPFQIPESLMQLYADTNQLRDIAPIMRNGVNLMKAYFRFNKLRVIERSTLRYCTELTHLDLRQSGISEIQPGALTGPKQLAYLRLQGNNLTRVGPRNIEGLNTQQLRLDRNDLQSLEPYTFGKTTGLGMVFFNTNLLEEVPYGLFLDPDNPQKSREFSRILLNSNLIRTVSPGAFLGVNPLVKLALPKNRLVTVPEEMLHNTTITGTLDLSCNQLAFIPDALLRGQSKLVTVYLQRNQIRFLDRTMFKGLHSLSELMVFDNPITQIADRMFYDTSLIYLYMFQTDLTTLGRRPFATIGDTLQKIFLYGNDFGFIADDVWADLGTNCYVAIDNTLKYLPAVNRTDLTIEFVRDDFRWSILVTEDVAQLLKSSGFGCSLSKPRSLVECSPCPRGYFGASWSSLCLACPPGGFYQNKTGQVVHREEILNCLPCNNGTYVTHENAPGIRPADCTVCPTGTNKSLHAGFRACPCLENFYRRDRFGQCFPCPGEGVNCSGEYQHLLPGYWWTWDWGSDGDVDAANWDAYASFCGQLVREEPVYDRHSFAGSLPKVHRCLRSEPCRNAAGDGINATCAEAYEGWLCSQCRSGFYSWLGNCFQCPAWWWFVLEVVAVAVVVILVVALALWDLRRQEESGRSAPSVLLGRGKILLGFYQVLGEILGALHELAWPQSLETVSSFLGLLEMNVLRLLISPRCYFPNFTYHNVYLEFVVGVGFVVAVIASGWAVHGSSKLYLTCRETPATVRDRSLARIRQRCLFFVVMLLFISYPSLSGVVFSLLPPGCDLFHLDEARTLSATRLRSDYAIDCSTAEYAAYNRAAEAALCYVVGFPSLLCLMLWREQRAAKGTSGPTERRSSTHGPPDVDEELSTLVNDQDNAHGQSANSEERKDAEVVSWQSFLCENYEDRFWYWEIVELARKVLQTLFVLLFGADDPFTLFASIVIAVTFLVVHAYVRPMRDPTEHRLQMCSLTAIFLNLLAASLLLVPGDQQSRASQLRKEALSVVLVLLNLSLVFFVAGSFVWDRVCALCKGRCVGRRGTSDNPPSRSGADDPGSTSGSAESSVS